MNNINVNPADFSSPAREREQKDNELKKACKEFESLLTYELLKSMRNTVDKCDLFHGGQGEEIYQSMFDQELSKSISGYGNNSISSMLYQQLSGQEFSDTGTVSAGIERDAYQDSNYPRWPVKAQISSDFGWRKDPFTGENRFHNGIDIAADEGAEVNASMSGKVIISDYREGYGNTVVLEHENGLTTLYAHNKENLVKPGDLVKKGTAIASVGSSGRSTGPHLHFEVKRNGKSLDPSVFLGA